jgi:hypothetical protein
MIAATNNRQIDKSLRVISYLFRVPEFRGFLPKWTLLHSRWALPDQNSTRLGRSLGASPDEPRESATAAKAGALINAAN